MKFAAIALTAALVSAPVLAEHHAAAPAAAAPAAAALSVDTDLGTLLDNPAAKAVLVKHIPAMVGNEQIEMARSFSLKQIQSFAADMLTDDLLAKIDADLKAIK